MSSIILKGTGELVGEPKPLFMFITGEVALVNIVGLTLIVPFAVVGVCGDDAVPIPICCRKLKVY